MKSANEEDVGMVNSNYFGIATDINSYGLVSPPSREPSLKQIHKRKLKRTVFLITGLTAALAFVSVSSIWINFSGKKRKKLSEERVIKAVTEYDLENARVINTGGTLRFYSKQGELLLSYDTLEKPDLVEKQKEISPLENLNQSRLRKAVEEHNRNSLSTHSNN